jgi:hypothetical protein
MQYKIAFVCKKNKIKKILDKILILNNNGNYNNNNNNNNNNGNGNGNGTLTLTLTPRPPKPLKPQKLFITQDLLIDIKKAIIKLSEDAIMQEFGDITKDSLISIRIMDLMTDNILEILVNINKKYYSMCFVEL